MSGCDLYFALLLGFCWLVLVLVVFVFLGGEVFDFLFSFFSNWRRKPKFLVNINFYSDIYIQRPVGISALQRCRTV